MKRGERRKGTWEEERGDRDEGGREEEREGRRALYILIPFL